MPYLIGEGYEEVIEDRPAVEDAMPYLIGDGYEEVIENAPAAEEVAAGQVPMSNVLYEDPNYQWFDSFAAPVGEDDKSYDPGNTDDQGNRVTFVSCVVQAYRKPYAPQGHADNFSATATLHQYRHRDPTTNQDIPNLADRIGDPVPGVRPFSSHSPPLVETVTPSEDQYQNDFCLLFYFEDMALPAEGDFIFVFEIWEINILDGPIAKFVSNDFPIHPEPLESETSEEE